MTASLREQIEAKVRRTEILPIQVGDAAQAAADVATARAALQIHQQAAAGRGDDERTEKDSEREEQLRATLVAALDRQAATVVAVRLQALDDDEWDAILDTLDVDEAGDLDLSDVRAKLLAASCVDEDLRDVGWWEEQLALPQWSKGDLLAINSKLLGLNLNTPSGASGKG